MARSLSTDSDTMTFGGVISGSGAVAQIGPGETILTADNPYTGGTNISAGTLAVGDFADPSATLSGGGPIAVASGGTLGGYGSVTGAVVNSGVIAAGSATPGLAPRRPGLSPSSAICSIKASSSSRPERASAMCSRFAAAIPARAERWLSIHSWEAMARPPTDLVINGDPAATGETSVHVNNVGGPGAPTAERHSGGQRDQRGDDGPVRASRTLNCAPGLRL